MTSSPGPLQLGSSGLVQNRKSTCRIHECVSQSRMSQPTISGLRWKTLAVMGTMKAGMTFSYPKVYVGIFIRMRVTRSQWVAGRNLHPGNEDGAAHGTRSRSGNWLFSDVQPFHAAGLVLSESERRHQLPNFKLSR